MSQLFAANHPERVDRVVLADTFISMRYLDRIPDRVEPGDPPLRTTSETVAMFRVLVDGWPENTDYFLDWFVPSQLEDPTSRRWFGRLQRMSASPRTSPVRSRASFGWTRATRRSGSARRRW